ncbi:MAG: right-handed parallel beta-helix repeat-containing protein [Candidatus Cloacimonetes bacterium]|nr:right-handed parallel beta-helix repeat-containing protein [Candidatus Cloacimonadota bacterium]
MGAYFFNQYEGPVWHISTTGSDLTGSGSEQYPFATIQHGVNASSNTDTVLVQPGTYVENIIYNGKLIAVASLFLTTNDTTYISSTIIDGDSTESVVTFESGEDSTTVLCGFTIINGLGGGSPDYSGGGITCINSSSPSLQNLTITGNSANYHGGGISCWDYSSPSLQNLTITGNSANYGGGIYCSNYSNPSLVNITITGNSAVESGGGISCGNYSSPSLQNVTITGNTASGGYLCGGGGIYCSGSSPSLENVTITGNTVNNHGGGIYCRSDSHPVLINSILWGNAQMEIYIYISGSVTATYSDIEGGWTGTGNINADPLFIDPGNNNYYLLYISPCIDTGDPASPLDPDGTIADMGAYYFDRSPGAPAITAVTDVPDDQGRCVHVIWNRSPYDAPGSPVPIESYSVWRYDDIFGDRGIFEIYEDPREIFEEASKDNDKNYYWQRDDEILTFITQLPAMGLVQYSIISPTLKDSSVVSINYSAFKVFAHTDVTLIYFPSFPDSGYSVDNIAPDETRVYIAQNGSNIGLTWDEVEYGTFQGNSYPELNGIWYRIYAGDSPDFVCGEAHLVDIVTDLNYDYPLMSEEKKFFKIVVSDQPGAGRTINQFAPLGPVRRSLGVGGKGRKPRFIGAEGFK